MTRLNFTAVRCPLALLTELNLASISDLVMFRIGLLLQSDNTDGITQL